jgi:hypothetical protein
VTYLCESCGSPGPLGSLCINCFNIEARRWWKEQVEPEMELREQAMKRHPLLKLLNEKPRGVTR